MPKIHRFRPAIVAALTASAGCAAVVVFLLSSLASSSDYSSLERPMMPTVVPTSVITREPRGYVDVAWLREGIIVEFVDKIQSTAGYYNRNMIGALNPDGSELNVLPLYARAGCFQTNYEGPTRLPDGRLGYFSVCTENSDTSSDKRYLMAYDFGTNTSSHLLDYPIEKLFIVGSGYSWDPRMSSAVAFDANGLREELYWLTKEKKLPIDLSISRSIIPRWSPNGQGIAFWGASEQGKYGIQRAESDFTLYLMNDQGSITDTLVSGIKYPTSLSWSPDGRWLAFTTGSATNNGIWLLNSEERRARLLVLGNYRAVSWSPDGDRLIALKELNLYPVETQVVQVDLRSIMSVYHQKP